MSSIRSTIAVYVTVVIGIMFASAVNSEELRVVSLPEEDVVLLTGDIIQGTAQRLDDILLANPAIKEVGMVSGGGLALEGFNIAEVLSNHDVTAVVPRGYTCLSACAIGFLGAKEYVVLGVLGFHNMYIEQADTDNIPDISLLIVGQSFGVRTTVFFLSNGFEVELPILISIFTTPEKFLVFTSTEDLMQFFARSETDDVTEYLEGNSIDQVWLDEHLWDTQRFIEFFGGDAG